MIHDDYWSYNKKVVVGFVFNESMFAWTVLMKKKNVA